LTSAKRDRIAPISIFFLLYISRIVVTMTNIQSVTTGLMKTDMLISVMLAMGINLLLSLPAIFCYSKHKNPFDVKIISWFYAAYFILLAAVNISRFSYFASTVLNPDSTSWIFSVIVTVCAFYGAYLGIESLSRFSFFAFILLVLTILAALLSNLSNYQEINLYPVIENDKSLILENVLYMVSSSTEVIVFLCLQKKTNGYAVKPFVWSVTASFLSIFVLLLFVNAVMGDAAALQAFPLYTLFELAKVGLFERMDVLHISFWIFGIFIKAALLIYCAGISVKRGKNSTKCIICSALTLAVTLIFSEVLPAGDVSPMMFVLPYLVICVIIPLLTLLFKKRNTGDELIEKF